MHPFMTLDEAELKDLQKEGSHYVAGFTDPGAERLKDMYDLFLDGEFIVSGRQRFCEPQLGLSPHTRPGLHLRCFSNILDN